MSKLVLETRVCNVCSEEKPTSQMVASSRYRGGFMPCCKECRNAYWRDRRASSPEFRKERSDAVRRSRLLRKYGITQSDYERMLVKQGDCCALCKSTDKGRSARWTKWNVDHDHKTGVARGLLCHSCNIAVGQFEKLVERVGSDPVLAYIKRGV